MAPEQCRYWMNLGTVCFQAVATFAALHLYEDALTILRSKDVKYTELLDVRRWPDLADLSRDPRFLQLMTSMQKRSGETK